MKNFNSQEEAAICFSPILKQGFQYLIINFLTLEFMK